MVLWDRYNRTSNQLTMKEQEPKKTGKPTGKRLEDATAEEVARAMFRAADRKAGIKRPDVKSSS